MLRSFSDLAGCTVGAMDGDLGGVRDVYFDDGTWTVRYLVVDTGEWLPGRQVLVSPMSIRNSDRRTLRVALTRTQVTHSPNVNTAKPVSRLDEIELSHYYGHPYYWVGPYRWGVTACPYPLAEKSPVVQEVPADPRQNGHQYLQNGTAVLGHAIQTEEGDIGRVEDVLVDDKAWAIRYMVVDAKNWWPGKKVFVSPEWLIHPTWDESTPLSCIVLAVPGGASNGRTAISPRPTVASRSSVGGAIQYRC